MDLDSDFIQRHTTQVSLRDGTRVVIRPVVAADKARLAAGLARLSPGSRYLRFLRPVDELSPSELAYLTELDYDDHFAWGALTTEGEGLGVARYVRDRRRPEVAEAAVAVVDDHQRRGLGTVLLGTLAETALARGIRRFRAYVAAENRPVLERLAAVAAEATDLDGLVELEMELPLGTEDMRSSALYRTLRAAARGEVEVRPPARAE